ncbi:MAG: ASCH domain-containing protein [Clostridia bacterium]|nr:ASCH domain-containing protein [Clostridia bacterium]
MVVAKKPKAIAKLNEALSKTFDRYALYLNYNEAKTNVILGEKTELTGGKEESSLIRGVKVKVNPESFLQVNDEIRDKIYDEVERTIDVKAGSVVVDAYAGVGLLGASFAKKGARVYNLEIVPEATLDGKRLAEENGLKNEVSNICCDSGERLPSLIEKLKGDLTLCASHEMSLRHEYFLKIEDGSKTFELKKYDEKRRSVKIGSSVCFADLESGKQVLCEVTSLTVAPSFDDLFEKVDIESCGFSGVDNAAAAIMMEEFYTKAEQAKYGVVAIGVKVVKPTITVVLDPPRKGCAESVLNAVKSADSLVYISCNPATLARDLKILDDTFRPERITPYDMFPNTRHVEVVVSMSRVGVK